MSASNEEPEFPDLAPIGLAFAQAITYINYKKYPNLDADAQAWLIDAATALMNQLKKELQELHTNKDDRTKLPPWALDPKEELCIGFCVIPHIPHVLQPYRQQFADSLQKLLDACRLNARNVVSPIHGILFYIRFPEAGLRGKGGDTSVAKKEFVFNEDFQKKFFGAVENMKIGG